MPSENVSFVTKESRQHFKEKMAVMLLDACLSLSTIKQAAKNQKEFDDIFHARELMIEGCSMVNLIILFYQRDDEVPKEQVEKARKHFGIFTDNYNKMVDYYKEAVNRFAERKTK